MWPSKTNSLSISRDWRAKSQSCNKLFRKAMRPVSKSKAISRCLIRLALISQLMNAHVSQALLAVGSKKVRASRIYHKVEAIVSSINVRGMWATSMMIWSQFHLVMTAMQRLNCNASRKSTTTWSARLKTHTYIMLVKLTILRTKISHRTKFLRCSIPLLKTSRYPWSKHSCSNIKSNRSQFRLNYLKTVRLR